MKYIWSFLLLMALNVPCIAQDMVTDCTIDALVSTTKWIEKDSLSTKSFLSKDGLDAKYQRLIISPHRYYLDAYNKYPHIYVAEKTIDIEYLIKKLNFNKINNISIYYDGMPFGKMVDDIKSGYDVKHELPVDSLYEVLYIQNQNLHGNVLSVVIGYCILDNNFQIQRLPLNIGYVYDLDKNGTWQRRNGHWIDCRQSHKTFGCGTEIIHTETSYDGDLFEHSMAWVKKFTRNILKHRKSSQRLDGVPDAFDAIKPYAYYRYQTALLKKTDESKTDAQPRFLCEGGNNTYILDDRKLANRKIEYECFAKENKSVVLKPLDIDTLSEDAKILHDYEIVVDSAEIANIKKRMTNSNVNEIRYVLTPAQINLSRDTITAEIKLYEIFTCADDESAMNRGKKNYQTRMLLVGKNQYKALFRYHKRKKKWVFAHETIEDILTDNQLVLLK